jgi:hypothetical protein
MGRSRPALCLWTMVSLASNIWELNKSILFNIEQFLTGSNRAAECLVRRIVFRGLVRPPIRCRSRELCGAIREECCRDVPWNVFYGCGLHGLKN